MRSLSLGPLLVASMSAAPLHAQEPVAQPAPTPESAVGAPAPRTALPGETPPATSSPEPSPTSATPAPLDTLRGHLALTAGGGLAVPLGRLQSGLPLSRRLGPGPAVALSATYGVSRAVALGLWGDMQRWGNGSACSSCSGTGLGAGALAAYHLVQGVRFDPWLAAGLGWRTLAIESDPSDAAYSGPEFLRLLVGGDWYATSLLALGPTLELAAGTYTKRPSRAGSRRAYWQLQTTLRVTLDLPGK
ncbi:MAG: hypothetical protein JW940_25320 [Polyangiaceae bacterium]|nr:hypothetical protein [Polyangiaceae bacterium]